MRHLGEALDQVRKSEYSRLCSKDRSVIKGQKYRLLSHRANLTLNGRRSVHKLLQDNRRLNVAYLCQASSEIAPLYHLKLPLPVVLWLV